MIARVARDTFSFVNDHVTSEHIVHASTVADSAALHPYDSSIGSAAVAQYSVGKPKAKLASATDHAIRSSRHGSIPEAEFSCRFKSGGRGGLRVNIDKHNHRELSFDDGHGGLEGTIVCQGNAPKRLGRSSKSPTEKENDCEDPAIRRAFKCQNPDWMSGDWPHEDSATFLSPLTAKCRHQPMKVLFLGLGPGSMHTHLAGRCPGSEMLSLEKNATVVDAAKAFFGFRGEVVQEGAASGMHRLRDTGRHFDAIVSDMGHHRMTKEDVSRASQLLESDGVLLDKWCFAGRQRHMRVLRRFFPDVVEEEKNGCAYYTARKTARAVETEHAAVIPEETERQPAMSESVQNDISEDTQQVVQEVEDGDRLAATAPSVSVA